MKSLNSSQNSYKESVAFSKIVSRVIICVPAALLVELSKRCIEQLY